MFPFLQVAGFSGVPAYLPDSSISASTSFFILYLSEA
jgi:hypothetical protein